MLVVLTVVVVGASGCGLWKDSFYIRNDTDQTLVFTRLVGPGGGPLEGTEREFVTLRPGGTHKDTGECISFYSLIVRTEDGTDVGSHSGEICKDDPWIISSIPGQ